MGVKNILFTHAAGSLKKSFRIGDIVLVKDHINAAGTNPFLSGTLDIRTCDPFQNVKRIYEHALSETLQNVLREEKIAFKMGVYAGVSGPVFETKAEARMFRFLGADIIGMSLVQEALTSFFIGMSVASLAYVSNDALVGEEYLHSKVLKRTKQAAAKFEKIISHLIVKI
jgi:purine-nucleoside phosphorylase